jgi:dihydroorotate dehydrogenase (NAD+) catalytic subunit
MSRRAVSRRPLIVKLSPNVTDIAQMAKAAEEAGADAISLINTVQAMAVDAKTRKPKIGAGMGGLSGPAVKPIALRMVYQAAKAVKIPIIGMGGIAAGEDVAEFLLCGAATVQVGTASFWDPKSPQRIASELNRFLDGLSIRTSAEIVGRLEMP